ncbi:xylan 1,4-beta-xylosidase [Planomonospora sp. ID67723]|uniref:GH39 family glycosyl hydrolase n=1 Tax=Planomonospora sp. ID67723 TaxID=2738134 RepID=UPI0027DBBBC0|nr:xylan 1,4-beta-xylosidase [Planomonospora sp. ID67723]
MIPSRGRHQRRRPSWPVALGAGVVTLTLITAIIVFSSREDVPRGQLMTIPPTQPAPTLAGPPATEEWPRWGVTHTEYSADNDGSPDTAAAAHLLSRVPMVQNQHIMGWGAGNPEPAPGKYDFRDLDRRIKLMADSQGVPVITLCCAPDWMKGGSEGRTDWSRSSLETAPQRKHFDDFAKLVTTVAKRYPTVKHYMVWNEFKGFWNNAQNRWDAESYTEMYNKVYDALKAVDKDIKVGGPYVPILSNKSGAGSELQGPWGIADQRDLDAVKYWIENKKGADFIVIDAASVTKDAGIHPDEFTALGKFGAITTWLREKGGDLPVWWAEWYVAPDDVDWTEERRTAVHVAAMMEFATSGATTALYWNPQRKSGQECPACLWRPGKGDELPMAGILSGFTKWFPAGVPLEPVTSSDPKVRVIAQQRMIVMVNTTNARVSTTVDGRQVELKPYEIRWTERGGA